MVLKLFKNKKEENLTSNCYVSIKETVTSITIDKTIKIENGFPFENLQWFRKQKYHLKLIEIKLLLIPS